MKLFFVLLIFVVGCVNTPTKVAEQFVKPQEPGALAISSSTRVLDVRPRLEYASGHLPQAHSVQWSDFSQPRTKFKGLLQTDLSAIARRLARLGIGPASDVLVIGLGHQGLGEEGRVAWMLSYLGVKNVRTATQDALKGRLSTSDAPPAQSEAVWDPVIDPTLIVSRMELTKAQRPEVGRKATPQARALEGERTIIIDVRSEREYLGMASRLNVPDMSAINVEWTNFYTQTGQPNPAILSQLSVVGIEPSQRILVVDDQGVRSAAVAFALKQLGFPKVGHYMGGLEEFLSRAR